MLFRSAATCARAARDAGLSVDGMVEKLNELATEQFGDIVIEATDNGYAVIGDYVEEVAKWTEQR